MEINWENELTMLEQSGKDIKSMKYNKGIALKDSKGFNGTALAIGIAEYFIQKNLETNNCSYMLKYTSLNSIVNRLIKLFGEDVIYDAYVNSPTNLEDLMYQHKIDYIDFAGRIDLHYKNLTKDSELAEAFLNQDINSTLESLEQLLGKSDVEEPVIVNQIEILKEDSVIKVKEQNQSEEPKIEFKQEEVKKEEIKTEVITPQPVKVNELKVDEPKKEEVTTVQNISYEEKIEQLAQDVLAGKLGSGRERKQALGDLYNTVQARVNQIAIESARGNHFGRMEYQTIDEPLIESRGELEIVIQKQEKKRNIFLIGWQKVANGFKKFFWKNNGDKVLALNPGTTVDESMHK